MSDEMGVHPGADSQGSRQTRGYIRNRIPVAEPSRSRLLQAKPDTLRAVLTCPKVESEVDRSE